MLYVAGEILLWMVLAFVLGLALGWFVWGYRSRSEAERAEREVQHRVGEAQQDAVQAQAQVQELLAIRARDTETIARLQTTAAASAAAAAAGPSETAALRQQVADLETRLAAATEERSEAEQRAGAAEDILEDHGGWTPVGEIPGMEQAQEQLGKPVILDDLKMVEGIGPDVEEVLQAAGITNWAKLAAAEPAQLRAALDAAGPQYAVHDPSTWPQQAVLALGGHWEALRTMQDGLRTGRGQPEPTG
jgi:predicted flap endonuclease-1-like 5' DNA nuclease